MLFLNYYLFICNAIYLLFNTLKHVEDKADFDYLFKEYYPQLYYYAFHLINNMEASKDIASDAFEFIWTNYAKIDKTTAKSYLYVYVRNKCIDYLRHQNVHEQYVQLYIKLTESYTETEYKEYDERMMRIHKAISTLTAHTRHILEECYVRRKKYQEVADELNISVSAVRKHIVKALSVLRKEFAKKE